MKHESKLSALFALFSLLGCDCGNGGAGRAELMDPNTCKRCHPNHFNEWSGSMHAFASADPVFRAMNARGQRETGGQLGKFCVECHAPMALREGATTDGLNLDQVPQQLQGVTCFFCHQIDTITGDHNAMVNLADTLEMRGEIRDPVDNEIHQSIYSPLHDRDDNSSAKLCGACHDIVTDSGLHLERTFAEWQTTVFATSAVAPQTCGNCHMQGREGVAADAPGVKSRRVKDHTFPGVDIALLPFPQLEQQRAAVQSFLDTTLLGQVCVIYTSSTVTTVNVSLDNVAAGHHWPSGASQDRRAWVELVGYRGDREVYASGKIADGQPVLTSTGSDLWHFGDRMFDAQGQEVHMFWEGARTATLAIPGALTNNPMDPAFKLHFALKTYLIGGPAPTRVTVKVRQRPIDFDVIDSLIQSRNAQGQPDLAPAIRDAIPTFDLATTVLDWRAENGHPCQPP